MQADSRKSHPTTPDFPGAFEAPGKVFLLGEYAVLAGRPAWLVATGPRFRLEVTRAPETPAPPPFSPASPAGKLFESAVRQAPHCGRYGWRWHDPHRDAGGFGASSAQFILLYRALAPELGWPADQAHALERFHSFHGGLTVPPSGADIATQWVGGLVRFDQASGAVRIDRKLDSSRLLLFSATDISGRKVKTHEHLRALGKSFFEEYRGLLEGMTQILNRFGEKVDRMAPSTLLDMDELAEMLDAYAEELSGAGLEAPGATADRAALRAHPAVATAKGTGAGLSDAVWVVLKKGITEAERQSVVRLAESRHLKLLSLSLSEAGISEAN